jgi:hypothetical protein
MTTYPLAVRGELDPRLSRGLWLVKWLLALPHYVVLWFLWVAAFVLTVGAFFAILFTGRYPRGIFDFNVGVLRWTWRVAFYSYGALGTDRYPPFSLADDPSYPAALTVAYPGQLSRGLVLVKWWLLALPHYLVVGVLVGGGGWLASRSGDAWGWSWSGGLAALLVLYAAVALLFTARYPRGIFDLVMGANRWALRVAAYALLMTDVYPPFRLDQGGEEPPTAPLPPSGGGGAPAEAETVPTTLDGPPVAGSLSTGAHWNAGRIVAVVIAGVVALAGLGLAAGGVAAIAIDQTQRDDDSYVRSPTESFSTRAYALVSERIDLAVDGPDWTVRDLLGKVRFESQSERPLFVGVARESDADRYLSGVERSVVSDLGHGDGGGRYDTQTGGAPAAPPAGQPFWAASGAGTGDDALSWKVEDGRWNVVVMNADGSRGVAADLRVGAELPDLLWIGIGLLAVGLVLLLAAAGAIYAAIPKTLRGTTS